MQIYVYVHNVSTGDYDNDCVNIIGDLFFYTVYSQLLCRNGEVSVVK